MNEILSTDEVRKILFTASLAARSELDGAEFAHDLVALAESHEALRAKVPPEGEVVNTADVLALIRHVTELVIAGGPETFTGPAAHEALQALERAAEGALLDGRFISKEHEAIQDPTPEDRRGAIR